MPRTKAPKSPKIKRKSAQDIAIEERLSACARKDRDEIIYVGNLVERTLKGEFGAVIKALTAGRIAMELDHKKSSGLSSDWHLGRASMGNDLWSDLEQFVHDKDAVLMVTRKEDSSVVAFNYSPD